MRHSPGTYLLLVFVLTAQVQVLKYLPDYSFFIGTHGRSQNVCVIYRNDVQVKVDLKKLQMGEEPNIMLAAGDILWVPETAGTKTMDFINKNFFLRFGATASYNVIGNATGVEYLNRRAQQSSQFSNGSGTLQNSIDPLGFLSAPGG